MSTAARNSWWSRLTTAWPGRKSGDKLPVRDQVSITPLRNTSLSGFDRPLLLVTVALLALGLVMVYSASVALPDSPKYKLYSPTFFLSRHALSLAIAFVAALASATAAAVVWSLATAGDAALAGVPGACAVTSGGSVVGSGATSVASVAPCDGFGFVFALFFVAARAGRISAVGRSGLISMGAGAAATTAGTSGAMLRV